MSQNAIDALPTDSPVLTALADFKELQARYAAAEETYEAIKLERNAGVYKLKSEYDVSFSVIAEIIGATSSLVLYLYERAQGKSAKQIREESQKSRAAKEQFRETDPNKPAARKQTPEEKAFRTQQREALKAFLASQKEAGADVGDGDPDAPTDDDE